MKKPVACICGCEDIDIIKGSVIAGAGGCYCKGCGLWLGPNDSARVNEVVCWNYKIKYRKKVIASGKDMTEEDYYYKDGVSKWKITK
jgi:hypothetical protein